MTGSGAFTTLRYEKRERVAVVTLDRPECLNAMNLRMHEELGRVWDDFDADDDIWLAVLTGAGDRAFSSGQDLKELAAQNRDGLAAPATFGSRGRPGWPRLTERFDRSKPVIARVNGLAYGGGFELALACDLRLAVEGARFALPESKRGMGANFGANVLARTVPSAIYAQWVYFGDFIGVVEAARWGIINEIVRPADLMPRSLELADELARRAPLTVGRYKAVLSRGRELPLAAALRADFVPDPYRSRDRVEGAAAFAEGRTPRWQGA